MVAREANSQHWCILRTSAARTLKLAGSLVEAGFEVWTPMQVLKRRGTRGRRALTEHDSPILPTFVFARAGHLPDLAAIIAMPFSPHPPFSIFRYLGKIPLISSREIEGLHAEEDRARKAVLKTKRIVMAPGTQVLIDAGGFAGLSGVVQRGDGKFAVVAFAGGFEVKIATFLLRTDEVHDLPDTAARAA